MILNAKTNVVTLNQILKNDQIKIYVKGADDVLKAIGFTEHGFAHAKKASNDAKMILQTLNFDDRTCELAAIAGYLHDIGNIVNRQNHAQSGAIMVFQILNDLGMDSGEIVQISSAIGHHDEGSAAVVSPIGAALILADKGDVRRTRVRNAHNFKLGIHDRVNYAVENCNLKIDEEHKNVILDIKIDNNICHVMEYFEIFLSRMLLCKNAAKYLSLRFELIINDVRLL